MTKKSKFSVQNIERQKNNIVTIKTIETDREQKKGKKESRYNSKYKKIIKKR